MSKQPRLERLQQNQQDALSSPNPLAIPEIIEMVGRCLSRHSLSMCLRVCHHWHQVLRPQIWKVVEMRTGENSVSDLLISNGPSLLLVRKNADHIRKLVLRVHATDVGFSAERPVFCPRLTELKVGTKDRLSLSFIGSPLNKYLSSFIVQHQGSLKKLVLDVGQSKELVDAISTCSHLESLTTTRIPHMLETQEISDWMDWYESQGSRLRSLTSFGWRSGSSNGRFIITAAMETLLFRASVSSLQSLELEAGYPTQKALILVMKSPELRLLRWLGTGTMTQLARVIESRPHELFCQKLESLSVKDHTRMTLADFRRVMEFLPALTHLRMMRFGEISGDILSYLSTLSSLRRLSISGCWATPGIVQGILCSMPNLQHFVADSLSNKAIEEDPRPWVCTGLKELTVSFIVLSGPFSDATTDRMMYRLCQLVGLERLNMSKRVVSTKLNGLGSELLRFRMESGLDRLKTLNRLQIFQAPVGQLWGEDEARWALKNWTQLRKLDIDMDTEAKGILGHLLMKNEIEDERFIF